MIVHELLHSVTVSSDNLRTTFNSAFGVNVYKLIPTVVGLTVEVIVLEF